MTHTNTMLAALSLIALSLSTLTACSPVEDAPIETGECFEAEVVDAASPIAFTELTQSESTWLMADAAEVITSEAELEAFTADHGVSFDESVDFATQQILVAGVNPGSTCGLEDPVVAVVEIDGAAHLSVEVVNPSGACSQVCDMAAQVVVAVVIDNGMEASSCARLVQTCDE